MAADAADFDDEVERLMEEDTIDTQCAHMGHHPCSGDYCCNNRQLDLGTPWLNANAPHGTASRHRTKSFIVTIAAEGQELSLMMDAQLPEREKNVKKGKL
jgi:hypothetical protein